MRSVVAILLALSLGLVGCGGSDDAGQTAGGNTQPVGPPGESGAHAPAAPGGSPEMPSYDSAMMGGAETMPGNEHAADPAMAMPGSDPAMDAMMSEHGPPAAPGGTPMPGDPAYDAMMAGGTMPPPGGEHDPAMMDPAMAATIPPPGTSGEHDPAMMGAVPGTPAYDAAMAATTPPPPGATGEHDPAMIGTTPGAPGYDAAMAGTYQGAPGSEGGYGPGGQAAQQPKTLKDKADLAWKQGHDYDAFQYYYAHLLSNDDAATVSMRDLRWMPGPKRPALAVRWAVGLDLKITGDLQGNLYPIGSKQNIPTGRSRRGNNADGGYDAAGAGMEGAGMDYASMGMEGGQGGKAAAITKVAGELGTMFVDEFTKRLERGDFGNLLREAGNSAAGQNNGGYNGYPGGAEAMYAGMPGAPGMMGEGGGGQAGSNQDVQIAPGVTFIGQNNVKELQSKAEKLGQDALVVFQVNVMRVVKTGFVINKCKMSLFDVRLGREVYKADELMNLTVQKARDSSNDKDPVEKEINDFFKFVDDNYKLVPMPSELETQHAITQVKGLLGKSYDNPLPILVEIKAWHSRGLLDDRLMGLAMSRLIDEQTATTLTTGPEEDRETALANWLPK